MGAAKPGPVGRVLVLPVKKSKPSMPADLTPSQQDIWREMAENPFLTEADYPLLNEAVEIMRIRDRAGKNVREFGSTITNSRGNQLMNPEYKVQKEMTESLMKLRERMLLTPQSRLKAGKFDAPTEDDDEIETD